MKERADASRGFEEIRHADSAKAEPYFDPGAAGILYFFYRFCSAT